MEFLKSLYGQLKRLSWKTNSQIEKKTEIGQDYNEIR
jgi:hypothetical protein